MKVRIWFWVPPKNYNSFVCRSKDDKFDFYNNFYFCILQLMFNIFFKSQYQKIEMAVGSILEPKGVLELR